jgi:hypothetical protein
MSDRRLGFWFVALALVLSAAVASSQTAGQQTTVAGTGTLSGTVIDAGSRAPIGGAAVSYSTDGNRTRTTVQSDEAGRFSFAGVPAGRLFISAQKPGYVGGNYGVRDVFAANQYFGFDPGEKVSGIVLRMWGNGALKGRVVDESGNPVASATVSAHRLTVAAGQLAMEREQKTVTNAQGEFQVPDLTPSRYLLSVSPSGAGQTRTFYPAARRASDATILEVGSSEIRPNVDVTLVRLSTVPVEGTVGAQGGLPPGLTVELVEEPSSHGVKNDQGTLSATVAADGGFAFTSVSSGRYVARVLKFPTGVPPGAGVQLQTAGTGGFGVTMGEKGQVTPLAPLPPTPTLYGETPVMVGDDAVRDLRLVLQPAGRIRGRVVFSGNAAPPSRDELVRTGVIVISAGGRGLPSFQVGRIEADGSFMTMGLPPGTYSLFVMPPQFGQGQGVSQLPVTWLTTWKTSRTTQDVQPLGAGLIQVGQLDTDVTITFSTEALGGIQGTVLDAIGKPVPEASVFIVNADRRLWTLGAQAREVRPGRRGGYEASLLPGEYLVTASVTAPEHWTEVSALEQLMRGATRVTLAVGEKKSIDLRIK